MLLYEVRGLCELGKALSHLCGQMAIAVVRQSNYVRHFLTSVGGNLTESSTMCGSDGNTCVSECRARESHCISLALIFVQPTLDVILLEFISIVCCVVN